MFRSIFKIAGAALLFAGVHSLLASSAAKRKASEVLGQRRRNALYRPLYNAQSLLTFGALVLYGTRLPDRQLYRIQGPIAWTMRLVQLYFLLFLLSGARQIGFFRFAGVPNLAFWLKGEALVPEEPEGQGPVPENENQMKITGPFRFSRHPLNLGMIPIFWLMPRMTVNLAGFNLIMTLYLIVGSAHEEKRLKEKYGAAYTNYQKSGINFFVPALPSFNFQKRDEE
jgi:steroid 5-alpha reductase family enzyme